MRRLALLLAGGALWLVFAAAPAFADGGPHSLINNTGTGTAGLAGDCSACHRAHSAVAADLLKAALPGLCLTCHDGTGSTVDVVDGVQFNPATWNGTPASNPVLGALRGGGFEYALIDTGSADRLSYSSRGGQTLTFGAAPVSAANNMTLHWTAFGSFLGGDLVFNAADTAANVQLAADGLFGTSAVYSGSTSAAYMTGLPAGNSNVVVTKAGNNFTFAPQNALRLAKMPLPTVTVNGSGTSATMTDGISVGFVGHVGVTSVETPVTSTHEGTGTVWGNGPQGQGNAGATGVSLECTNCHNPHGNGQYRILNTLPGEDWSNGANLASTTLGLATTTLTNPITVASATGFPDVKFYILVDSEKMYVTAGQGGTSWTVTRGVLGTTAAAHLASAAVKMITTDWTPPTNAVEVIDGPTLTAGQVRNYTILPSTDGLTTGVVGTAANGDYFRYKYDPSGTTNFTNFYLRQDPMNSGWNGQTPTNAAAIASIPNTTVGAGGITATATSLLVVSTTGMPTHTPTTEPQPTWLVKIDSEILSVSVTDGTHLKVSRAQFGTIAASHSLGAIVAVVGTGPSQDAADVSLLNYTGRMTAFCIACHTRYNGWAQNGTSSLNAQTPNDATFMYKHGTTSIGCEQCHVNHGSNAQMTGVAATINTPDGTISDSSRLLKVDNRGTCQLCHDPTGTVTAGNTIGTVPGSITSPAVP